MKKTYQSPSIGVIQIGTPRIIMSSGDGILDDSGQMRFQSIERRDAYDAASRVFDDWDWDE
jgi:hypothetical protein